MSKVAMDKPKIAGKLCQPAISCTERSPVLGYLNNLVKCFLCACHKGSIEGRDFEASVDYIYTFPSDEYLIWTEPKAAANRDVRVVEFLYLHLQLQY